MESSSQLARETPLSSIRRIMKASGSLFGNHVDVTTILLCCARFASAMARLSLGPLLPLLKVDLAPDDKPFLLSSYSTGYVLTQIVGGMFSDRFGATRVLSISCGISGATLLTLTMLTSASSWRYAFFVLGVTAGPLFPACQTAARQSVEPALALAYMDTAAAIGATFAAASPLLPSTTLFYLLTAGLLLLVSFTAMRHNSTTGASTVVSSNKTTGVPLSLRQSIQELLNPSLLRVYMCHSVDNFTKYGINAWAVSILVSQYHCSPGVAGIILGLHEGITVVSRLYWVSSSSRPSNAMLLVSSLAFLWQGVFYQIFFYGNYGIYVAGCAMMIAGMAAGVHSIGYRTCYTSGKSAGVGNSIASFASIASPMIVYEHRQSCFILVNIVGAVVAGSVFRQRRQLASSPRSTLVLPKTKKQSDSR